MRFSKLLVLSALCLSGISAQAAIVGGVRQKPEPASFVSYQLNDTVYLYNTGAKMFFLGANDWSTRASVGDKGYKVVFQESASAPEGTVELTDFVETQNAMKSTFSTADGEAIWVDNSSETYRFWSVTAVGDAYRIANPVREGSFLGWNGSAADTRLYLLTPETEGAAIDWKMVAPAVYESWLEQLPVFNKAQELKAVLDEAKEKGIDVSAQEAVYLNESATIEELEAAIAAVKEAIANQAEGQASVSSPVDMTGSLTNPAFDDGTSTGWSGTAPGMSGDGNHAAAHVAEHYNKTFDTYQALTNMPKGVYKMNAKTFFRGTYDDLVNGTNKVAYLYAATADTLRTYFNNAYSPLNTESLVGKYGSTTYFDTPNVEGNTTVGDVTYYIPNNPSTFRLYYEEEDKDWYDTNLFFTVSDGNATLGVKKEQNITTTDWAVFDQFNLTYYGNAAEAYQYWVDEYIKTCQDYSELSEDVIVTEAYVDAYNETLQGVKASNREEALAAIAAVEAAVNDITLNISLWNQYKALIDWAMQIKFNEDLDQDRIELTYGVGDWAELDSEDVLKDHSLTNEELQAEVDKWTAILNEVKNWYKAVEGERVDMTNLLTNPDFTGGANGWTREAVSGGNVAWGSNCYEAWNNASFDVYQVVKDAPEGVYEIEVQGFYRYLRGDNAWNAYQTGTEQYVKKGGAPVFVYMNAKQTPFQNVFDEPVTESYVNTDQFSVAIDESLTYYFPNNMANSNEAFTAGMYKQSAYGIIRKGQDMRIGVKGQSNQGGDSWVIWDNFKLYNVGNNATVLKTLLPDEVANAKALLSENMGKTIYENLVAAINAAEAALTSDDGDVLFDALSNLFDAEGNVNASIALFNELNAANENLMDDIGKFDATASATAKGAAGALYEEISAAIAGHQIEDADVADYLIKIKTARTQLRMPADYADASDLSPKEFSPVIVNNAYDENNSGWDGTATAYNATAGNVEIFGANFDYYQDIYGLPAGTYQLSVQGFYRAGGFANDYTSYMANPDSLNYAFYYGMVLNEGDSIYSSKTLKRLAADALAANPGDGFVEVGSGKYVPNSMVAAGDAFLTNVNPDDNKTPLCYTNEPVTFKVGADGYARVGLKKDVNLTDNWCIWDNWTLTYFGPNSELVVDGDASQGIENVQLGEPVRTEFFTLDGRKTTGLMKGIVIMKQTMGNGAVIIKKIRK